MVGMTLLREAYRRELLPERSLWWLAAAGMRDWYRVLAKELAPALPDSRATLARLGAKMFERRGEVLSVHGKDLALLMGALYRVSGAPKAAWIFDGLGGSARGTMAELRARHLLATMTPKERWFEVATHLGELLIVLTEDLPGELPHARKVLADICFSAGARYARRMKGLFGMAELPADAPKAAIEILRISEYVFRVNPEHWHDSDGASGFLEGSACPWWSRPGWNGAHCGIFGQFQSGISSEFGLHYHLAKTIPKHGGDTCRIDLKPITLRRKDAAS